MIKFPLNPTYIILAAYFSVGARLLLDVVGGLMASSDNPLDFHSEISSVLPISLKYLYIG